MINKISKKGIKFFSVFIFAYYGLMFLFFVVMHSAVTVKTLPLMNYVPLFIAIGCLSCSLETRLRHISAWGVIVGSLFLGSDFLISEAIKEKSSYFPPISINQLIKQFFFIVLPIFVLPGVICGSLFLLSSNIKK